MRSWVLVVAVVAATAVFSACGDGAGSDGDLSATSDAGSAGGPGATASSATSEAADPAGLLSFEAPMVQGGSLDLGSLAGEDLALWFWAPW